jgi:hypothetical protein
MELINYFQKNLNEIMRKTLNFAIIIFFILVVVRNIKAQDNITAQEIIQNVQNVYKNTVNLKRRHLQVLYILKRKANTELKRAARLS